MTSRASLGSDLGDIAREILAGRQLGASVSEFAGNLFRASFCNAEDFEFRFFFDFGLALDLTLLTIGTGLEVIISDYDACSILLT